MSFGDTSDFLARLKAVLPNRWFGDTTPVLDGVLSGLASAWSWIYQLLAYTKTQARIATASGAFLDMIAIDFFGTWIRRRTNESDATFRSRLQAEMLRPRGTRAALVSALVSLTGRTPTIFEPCNPADTGGYNLGGVGYGVAGGYGSLALPFQAFVTAYRPVGLGIAGVAGYGGGGFMAGSGGYGLGAVEYASTDMIAGTVSDAEIYTAVARTLPAATIAWTAIA